MTPGTRNDAADVMGEATHSPAAPAAMQESLEPRLAQYGIDLRARSALRALARFQGVASASPGWAAGFVEGLPATDPHLAHRQALAHFADLFYQLPARDFGADWLEELSGLWITLLDGGCDADLPLLAARDFAGKCAQALARDRESFSRIDAEIALAVGAAGLFVCAVLAQGARDRHRAAVRDAPPADAAGAAGSVRNVLAAAMALDGAGITGLLVGQIVAGSTAMLGLEEEMWAHVYARALSRLRTALRDRDVLCRVGRSRFALVLPGLSSTAQVMLAANRLARSFDAPLAAAGRECRLMVRIGAAWAPEHATDAAELLRRSHLALHEASRYGRSVVIFEDAFIERAERDARMEEDFLRALDRGGLELYFQPQIELATGRCTGAEALLRWPGARGGPVAPPLTIEVAERLGVAPQLTRWILHQACRGAAEFARGGIPTPVSVNLTAGDIADPELPLAVRNALELWHVEPGLFKFELTESAMLANEAVSARVMAGLRELGVATSIDDFGTGYSSVLLLKQLPLNELKLDRSFVASAVHSHQDREIVRSLILLAHSLGLEVVAEGVEDSATLALLRDFGCDRAQGFLVSHPLPADRFQAWLRAYDPRSFV